MTTAETEVDDVDTTDAEAEAGAHTGAEGEAEEQQEMPAELAQELAALSEAALECWNNQATFRLLDPTDSEWIEVSEPGVHSLVVDGVPGTFTIETKSFEPIDWELMEERLQTKLAGIIGDAPLAIGDEGHVTVNWKTAVINEEGRRLLAQTAIEVTADSNPTPTGAVYQLALRLTPEGAAEVSGYEMTVAGSGDGDDDELTGMAEMFGVAEDEAAAADGITAVYLREHFDYGYPHGNRSLSIDWDTWTRTGSDGEVVRFTAKANDVEHHEQGLDIEGEFVIEELQLKLTSGPEDYLDELDGVTDMFEEAEADAADADELAGVSDMFEEAEADAAEAEYRQALEKLHGKWGDLAKLIHESIEYDVSLKDLEDDGEDNEFWYVKTTAKGTVDGEVKDVSCRLQFSDENDLAIESVSNS